MKETTTVRALGASEQNNHNEIHKRLLAASYAAVEREAQRYGVDSAVLQNYVDRRLSIEIVDGQVAVLRTKKVNGNVSRLDLFRGAAAKYGLEEATDKLCAFIRGFVGRIATGDVRKLKASQTKSADFDTADDDNDHYYGSDEIEWIREAMDRLDPDTYAMVYARVVDKTPFTEIGERFGMSRYAVMRRVNTGLIALKDACPFTPGH